MIVGPSGGPAEVGARPTLGWHGVFLGQSFVNTLQVTNNHWALMTFYRELVANPSLQMYLQKHGYGGSSMLPEHNRLDVPNWHWVADTNANGPLLVTTLGAITAQKSGRTAPTLCGLLQSQQDAVMMDMTGSVGSIVTTGNKWIDAQNHCFSEVRSNINSGSPTSVPGFMDMEGRRQGGTDNQRKAIALLRDLKLAYIATATNIHFLNEEYDVPLPVGDDHPTDAGGGTIQFGLRQALALDNVLNGASNPQGPTIVSWSRISTYVVRATISAEAGMSMRWPSNADIHKLFKFFAGSTFLGSAVENVVVSASRSGFNIDFTLTSSGQVTAIYPWVPTDFLYPDGGTEETVIRYLTKVHADDIGLPLRSKITTVIAA